MKHNVLSKQYAFDRKGLGQRQWEMDIQGNYGGGGGGGGGGSDELKHPSIIILSAYPT